MIAHMPRSKGKSGPTTHGGIKTAIEYARHREKGDPETAKSDLIGYNALLSEKTASKEMRALADRAKEPRPVYGMIISLAPGEKLSAENWKWTVEKHVEKLGMKEHQWIAYRHRNTDCEHVHVIVNTIHPETLKQARLWNDRYKTLEASRECAKQLGLHVVRERAEERPAVAPRVAADKAPQRPLGDVIAPAVSESAAHAKNWQQFHQQLALRGIKCERFKDGIVFEASGERTKGSAVGRAFSRAGLEKRFGAAFEARAEGQPVLNRDVRGEATTQRAQRAAATKAAREALWAEFQALNNARRAEGQQERTKRRAMARDGQQADFKRQREIERARRSALWRETARGGFWGRFKRAFVGLMDADRAKKERATIKAYWDAEYARIKAIRGKAPGWREFLEERAAQGHEGARSAIRGMEYAAKMRAAQNQGAAIRDFKTGRGRDEGQGR